MATDRQEPRKRKRLLVNRLQYRLLAYNLLYLLAFFLVFSAFLIVPPMLELRGSGPSIEKDRAAVELLSLHTRVLPILFLSLALLTVHSVVVSHRIFGCLVRFKSVYRHVADGDLSGNANIRRRDYLQEEAADLNAMLDGLRERIGRCQGAHKLAREDLETLLESVESDSREELARRLDLLHAHLAELGLHLDRFRLEEGGKQPTDDEILERMDPIRPSEPSETTQPLS